MREICLLEKHQSSAVTTVRKLSARANHFFPIFDSSKAGKSKVSLHFVMSIEADCLSDMKPKVKVINRKCYCEICEAISKLHLSATAHEMFACARAEDHECGEHFLRAA